MALAEFALAEYLLLFFWANKHEACRHWDIVIKQKNNGLHGLAGYERVLEWDRIHPL